MNPTVMDLTAPHQHDDAARSLRQVEGVRHRFVKTSRLRVHIAEAGEGEPVLRATTEERLRPSRSIDGAGAAPTSVPEVEARSRRFSKATFWLPLTIEDGTSTAGWALVGIVAPALVALSSIAIAIMR
jgi:hypothetical protein